MVAWRNDPYRYGAAAQGLHWIIALLIVVQFALAWYAQWLGKVPLAGTVFAWHKSIGVVVLGLAVIRLGWRIFDRPPPLVGMRGWERAAAQAGHFLLYLFLFAQPLSGLLLTLAGKRPLVLFGGWTVPNPIGPNPALHEAGEAVHYWVSWALLVVAALHLLAALRHHWVLRDTVLVRMLPGARARRLVTERYRADARP